MFKKYAYLILVLLFIGAVVLVVVRYQNTLKNTYTAFYPLQEREGTAALAPEWASLRIKAGHLMRVVRESPEDRKSALALAALYIQEGRITGKHLYYDAAALHYINEVLQEEPQNFEALTLQALTLLSQHHFADALAVAEKAKKENPYNAFVYGLLVDGQVEMGNYEAAVQQAEKMVSLRPDLRSYARIAYLREIFGDYPGATEAMLRAVKAGGYGDEPTCWARTQLARLYELTGDRKSAVMHYTIALEQRPGYAFALAGLGHIAMGVKDYPKAISLYLKADTAVQDYAIREQLVQLYRLSGQEGRATALVKAMIAALRREVQKGEADKNIGHYADRELAYAYLLTGDKVQALQHALAEYNRRPHNIDVNETVAWVYYKQGLYRKALPFIEIALRTGSRNPVLLIHAGLIYQQCGQQAEAKNLLQHALKNNPNIDMALLEEGRTAMQKL